MTVVLLSTHAITHRNQDSHLAKPDKVRRPEMTSDGTTENWTYFLTRWRAYVRATKLTGEDLVIQLLECCDEKLRSRNTGGVTVLEEMAENEILAALR